MASADGLNAITGAEHIGPTATGDNIEAKRVAGYIWDDPTNTWVRVSGDSTPSSNTLTRLMNVLARPEHYDPVNNALRVNVALGTITTVTTVTTVATVTSLNQLAGFDTKLTLQYPLERELWANAIRRNIT